LFEQALSIDEQRRYKPHPATYHAACQRLGVAPAATLLVAAHGWDVAGALRAGLAAAFIARPSQAVYPLAEAPTYTAPALVALAQQLAGGKGRCPLVHSFGTHLARPCALPGPFGYDRCRTCAQITC